MPRSRQTSNMYFSLALSSTAIHRMFGRSAACDIRGPEDSRLSDEADGTAANVPGTCLREILESM
jgi:hypothetical protein